MSFFNDTYQGRRVFLTGLSGFKGSWLAVWLKRLGAELQGFSQAPLTNPNHVSLLNLSDCDQRGDIRDFKHLQEAVGHFQPEIVFHLAAQPLVRKSYEDPLETFSTNIQGTANLLHCCRATKSVRAVVVITTDKVYENQESPSGYKETDRLGGYDPYAASKACAEIVVDSFRKSFYEKEGILLASARAGNVIGGGDWATDRLIPDLVRAAAREATTTIRMPHAVRPWEHVLEPLAGYLLLGQKLLEGKKEYAEAWNFGPDAQGHVTVGQVVEHAARYWNRIHVEIVPNVALHETSLLTLDCTKAKQRLGWKPIWDIERTLEQTVNWYKRYHEDNSVLTGRQLDEFIEAATLEGAVWTV